jgi:hypothetical protein
VRKKLRLCLVKKHERGRKVGGKNEAGNGTDKGQLRWCKKYTIQIFGFG